MFLLSWGNRHLLLNMSPDHLFYFFNVSFFRLVMYWEHWGIGDAEEAAFSLHRPRGPCWLFQPCPGSTDPRVWLMAGGVCPELGLNIHRSLGSWFCWLCTGSPSRELYVYWLGSSDSWMWFHVTPVSWCVKLPLATRLESSHFSGGMPDSKEAESSWKDHFSVTDSIHCALCSKF